MRHLLKAPIRPWIQSALPLRLPPDPSRSSNTRSHCGIRPRCIAAPASTNRVPGAPGDLIRSQQMKLSGQVLKLNVIPALIARKSTNGASVPQLHAHHCIALFDFRGRLAYRFVRCLPESSRGPPTKDPEPLPSHVREPCGNPNIRLYQRKTPHPASRSPGAFDSAAGALSDRTNNVTARSSGAGKSKAGMPAPGTPLRITLLSDAIDRDRTRRLLARFGPRSDPCPSTPWQTEQRLANVVLPSCPNATPAIKRKKQIIRCMF